ncbi:MAG: metallophosphoesterase [Candidatus Korarchaeum sp.]|nr:metallophosphoesterase [Candidatus Korarchaeum sp.]MDW8035363.1 metallophosphoesterase [Candidatus Korarchaeum sp.]
MADLHVQRWGGREEAIRDLLANLSGEFNVAFVLGDSYDERTRSLEPLTKLLSEIEVPKFGVLGNHEHWADRKIPLSRGIEALEGAGVRVLLNEAVEEMGIRIGGIDWYIEDKRAVEVLNDLGKVDLLLSHTPDVIELQPRAKLVLAGHTHGGQVCLPLIGPIWTPSKYGTRYASGLFEVRGSYLYVSRGLGEKNPLRFNCPRELTLLSI